MKELLKLGLALALAFASTFLLLRGAGLLDVDDIRRAIERAAEGPALWVAAVILLLLMADLIIAVPTMTLCILAGHFLGATWGALTATAGMMLAGVGGYVISRRLGWRLLQRLAPNPVRLAEIQRLFATHGVLVLIVCRAAPIVPEVSCCLAGATRMPFGRFLGSYALGTMPYAVLTAYAGSVSSWQQPLPAISMAVALTATLALVWWWLIRRTRLQHTR